MFPFRLIAPACLAALCFSFVPAPSQDQHNAPGYCAAEVSFTCPIDKTVFGSPVAYSITNEGIKRDLMEVNGAGKYYEHLVHQCPKCHYCGRSEDFETELTVDQVARVQTYLVTHAKRRPDEVQENLLAAKIYDLLGADDYAQADFFLYASYLLRNKPALATQRRAYQLKSAELYLSKEFGLDEASQKVKAQTLYLVGELYRRAGKFDLSTEIFAQADNTAHKPEWLPAFIEEQAALALAGNADDNI
jgi:uncharacterized protein (DUF2225 family)